MIFYLYGGPMRSTTTMRRAALVLAAVGVGATVAVAPVAAAALAIEPPWNVPMCPSPGPEVILPCVFPPGPGSTGI
jgi:hypothetical protein